MREEVGHPPTIRQDGHGCNKVEPEVKTVEVSVDCVTSQHDLDEEREKGDQSDCVKDVVVALIDCNQPDVLENQRVNGNDGHEHLDWRAFNKPFYLGFELNFLVLLFPFFDVFVNRAKVLGFRDF